MSDEPNTTDSAKGDKGDQGDQGNQGDRGPAGPRGPKGESKLAQAAEEQVERLIKAKSTPKWWGRVLSAVCVALLCLIGIGIWNVHRVSDLAQSNAHGAYTSCLAGNTARATNEFVWDSFITLILSGDKNLNDQSHAKGATFEKLIASNEKAQDCAALYPGQAPPK